MKRAGKGRRADLRDDAVWLLTFGDLLTLILCLFLALIASGGLGTAAGASASAAPDAAAGGGTVIAPHTEGGSGRVLFLTRDEARDVPAAVIRHAVDGADRGSQVTVGACGGDGPAPWSDAATIAADVRRAIVAAGVPGWRVRAEVFGPDCGRLGGPGAASVSADSF